MERIKGGIIMDYNSEESFLEKAVYLWEKDFLEDLFNGLTK